MPRCAFLTLEDPGNFVIDDHLAVSALQRKGWDVEQVPWRSDTRWELFDLAVVRTTWDYWNDVDAFVEALGRIARATALYNPLQLVRWNIEKTYLRELATRGVAIVPTAWSSDFGVDELSEWGEAFGVDELIVKPTISANADRTYRFSLDAVPEAALELGKTGELVMIQPFLPSVLTRGEVSLVFFDGRLSHTVSKRPKAGDFRVQEEHGGLIRPIEPPPAFLDAARHVLARLDVIPLYARVDLVEGEQGDPLVMEVELVEPSLYFRTDPDAGERFAQAVVDRVTRDGSRPSDTDLR